ncbi:MAG TPA: YbjN domain-containing protein [Edaphobacter sp.]|nr:YbjN domain-containing protein [Edaphobacter sp.]
MTKNRFIPVALFGTLLVVCPSLAQSKGPTASAAAGSSKQLVSTMTLEEFQRRVQSLGFQCERGSTDGKLDSYFTFRAEGRKVAAKMATAELPELFVYYTDGASLATVNEWNNTHFASTAFVEKDGTAVLENLLVLTGGVSEENVEAFITNFRDSAADYARFILDHAKAKTEKPAP